MENNLWWAYRHINGEIIAKRFLSWLDMAEARLSPFVEEIRGPVKGTKDDAFALFCQI
jgi:hypothetical protein